MAMINQSVLTLSLLGLRYENNSTQDTKTKTVSGVSFYEKLSGDLKLENPITKNSSQIPVKVRDLTSTGPQPQRLNIIQTILK